MDRQRDCKVYEKHSFAKEYETVPNLGPRAHTKTHLAYGGRNSKAR
jgi:hypothetical protein